MPEEPSCTHVGTVFEYIDRHYDHGEDSYPLAHNPVTSYYVSGVVRLPSLGKIRLVVSFDNPKLTGSYALFVSNRLDWSAQRILSVYLQRWPVETFYQDSKTNLGLDDYRMRSVQAIGKHWCLVFVAYSFLHLDCLAVSLKDSRLPLKTIGHACRQQTQALLEALIHFAVNQLHQGETVASVLTNLFAKQVMAVT
ncbi:MAG: transposase [Aggregatilineales bacterium]